MKKQISFLSACWALGTLLAGCVGHEKFMVKEPVGPIAAALPAGGGTGRLIVYSAWDGLDTLDPEHRKHTSYTVLGEKGSRVTRVRNQSGSFESEPDTVALPPGQYAVEAEGTNVGTVRVPVVIRGGQTTVVYLDGTTQPLRSWESGTNWVREPGGLIVGWKDQPEPPARKRASVSQ
jgi:hypothetical protein